MKFLICFLTVCCSLAATRPADQGALLEKAIINIEITRRQYDHIQPWNRRVDQVSKIGTLISPTEILTTAEYFSDQTLIRLQKQGRGRWFKGKLLWADYHANLALVTCEEDQFWDGLKPLSLAEKPPRSGTAQLARWRNGNMEARNVEINRYIVKQGKITFIDYLHLEVDSEINGTGWAEAIVQGNKLIGITSSKEESSCTVLPSSFIRNVLEAHKQGDHKGLGYFAFVWQRSENPATLDYFKLPGEPRGVMVIDVPHVPGETNSLMPKDIILEIDGFSIDLQGDYNDPQFGNLLLENLATRNKWAGDKVKLKVWRQGQMKEVGYTLPKAEYSNELVPSEVFDTAPEYAILGGLVFQPLTVPFLRSWGADWLRKAPFRLAYSTRQKKRPDEPSLIMLSLILPDPINIGYQESRYLLVESINGRKVHTIGNVLQAIEHPRDGFHEILFKEGDSLRRMVLEASELPAATQRVLQRYGIQEPFMVKELPGLKTAQKGSN
ncbi:MAG: hypothetical protein SFY81_11455 [Verrucomicrobiota bacterium]|nr:hypothetical protein [Verrucomicrobiota bacterium]